MTFFPFFFFGATFYLTVFFTTFLEPFPMIFLRRASFLTAFFTTFLVGKTIFFDWAIQISVSADPAVHIKFCISYYGDISPNHPMTSVLEAALAPAPQNIRRGGRAGRVNEEGQRRDGQSL